MREQDLNMRVSFNRWTLLLCVCVLLMANAHVCFADDLTLTEAYFTQEEQFSGLIEVPGKGLMRYYAQNDPLWRELVYESGSSSTRRPFRDSGCGPTAGAMAVAALVPEEELIRIAAYAKQEYSLCSCSVNQAKCNKRHARYVLTTQRDFVRFLPLVFGDFATGNNTLGDNSRSSNVGTATGFLYDIAEIYGLTVTATPSYGEAIEALEAGDAVVAMAGKGGAFTSVGHYVLLASIDDEKLYILDPLCRTEYKTNQGRKIEIIQPGLVALTHANVPVAQFSNFLIFRRGE